MDKREHKPLPPEERHQPENPVQAFYERFRGVPLRVLDGIILACIAGLILVVALGIWKARHSL